MIESKIQCGFLKCNFVMIASFRYAQINPAIKTNTKNSVKTMRPVVNMDCWQI